jgi:hypothetical protein
MLNLKAFLDGLADENHPFRKGPDLREGSALEQGKIRIPLGVRAGKAKDFEEQQRRFYFMRLNKN